MRVPKSLSRSLLGAGVLLLCLGLGGGPCKADAQSGYVCTYSICKGMSVVQNGLTCDFSSTNAGWICVSSSGSSCTPDAGMYGTLTCYGSIRGSNPPQICTNPYPCCDDAPP